MGQPPSIAPAVMLAALQNVRPSHLLDQRLWSALGLQVAPEEAGGGDVAGNDGLVPEGRLARGPTPRDEASEARPV